jgi:transcriptional regulator with XRE-family HTH domain
MAFSDTIRAARDRLDLSQTDVAQRAGITQATYSRIESGRNTTTAATARAICAAIGLDPRPAAAHAALENAAEHDARQRGVSREQALRELRAELSPGDAAFAAAGTDGDVDFWSGQLAGAERFLAQWTEKLATAATADELACASRVIDYWNAEVAKSMRALDVARSAQQ